MLLLGCIVLSLNVGKPETKQLTWGEDERGQGRESFSADEDLL